MNILVVQKRYLTKSISTQRSSNLKESAQTRTSEPDIRPGMPQRTRRHSDAGAPADAGCAPQSVGKRQAIIVFNGCFNPVHAGHVAALEEARRQVEAGGA